MAPRTENDPKCVVLQGTGKRVVGLYPAELQADPKFCDVLAKQPNAKDLMDHFSVVVAGDKPGTYKAVPYSEAWKDDMEAVARELDAAAAAITSPGEAAFKTYLTAQAKAFRTNDWTFERRFRRERADWDVEERRHGRAEEARGALWRLAGNEAVWTIEIGDLAGEHAASGIVEVREVPTESGRHGNPGDAAGRDQSGRHSRQQTIARDPA